MRKDATWIIVGAAAICLLSVIAVADGLFDFARGKPAATQPQAAKPTTANVAKPPPATAPVAPPAQAAAGPSIVVAYARYGSGDRWADVTEPCKRLVSEHGLKFPRDMHRILRTDPVPGFMKYLELSLVINGVEVWLTVGDNLQLDPLNISTEPPPEPK
ncbi:MAG: hypothetical protein JWN40_5943 [Phycisphaerales bacterium]|nr:hypothetical protein [Phycisphaerales bacterium]